MCLPVAQQSASRLTGDLYLRACCVTLGIARREADHPTGSIRGFAALLSPATETCPGTDTRTSARSRPCGFPLAATLAVADTILVSANGAVNNGGRRHLRAASEPQLSTFG
jgi:hypothetical protein